MVELIRPRLESVPPAATSLGRDAVELARSAGLDLDEWQAYVLECSLGLREDNKWSAFEVGVNVARQNGKGTILEARELAGLFLIDDDQFLIHSAHLIDTSLDACRRLEADIEEAGLMSDVKRIARTNGQEGIELRNGKRIRFRTRTKGGGRGFSCDCLVLDEAMFLAEFSHSALIPTLSSRRNPQIWYAGSAVDQEIHEHGVVWAKVRERGIAGDDPALAYFEWSAALDNPNELTPERALDQELWAIANPSFGIRISAEYVEKEQRSMDARGFAVERLGVGDWPRTDGVTQHLISVEDWLALVDEDSYVAGDVCFAFDVGPERTASIAVAGIRDDGLWHVEIVENRTGTSWLPKRLAELVAKHAPQAVVCDGYGPAASLMHAIDEAGVDVKTVTAGEHGQACGRLVDAVNDKQIRHLGTDELASAVRGAKPRPLGDAWAWSRKSSAVDISPLVAATLALSEAMEQPAGDVRIYW